MTSAFYPAQEQSTDPQSDPQLISLVRGGDTDAYGLLYERHLESARRLARVLSSDHADADDLIADTFAKVLAVLRNGGGPDTAFRAYLLTTMRHTRYDRARRERRLELTDDLTRYETAEPVDDPTISRLETSYAARAFNRLPERWRAVLWHTEVEGESPSQVAPLLGLTPNGVAALAYRARERLRQMYLQEHIALTGNPRCHWTGSHLAGYVRAALAKRDRGKVDEHLSGCSECRRLHRELTEENAGLRSVIAPLLLGAAAPAYLAGAGRLAFGGRLAAAWGALVLWWPQVRETVGGWSAAAAGLALAGGRWLLTAPGRLISRYGGASIVAGTGVGIAALAGIVVFVAMTATPTPRADPSRAVPVPAPAAPPVFVPPPPSPRVTTALPSASPPGSTAQAPPAAQAPPVDLLPARPAPVTGPKPPPAAPAPVAPVAPVAPAPPAEPDAEVSAPEFTEVDLVAGRAGTLPIPVRASADDRADLPESATDTSADQPGTPADTPDDQSGTAADTPAAAPGTVPEAIGAAGGAPTVTVAAQFRPTALRLSASAAPEPSASPAAEPAAPPGAVRIDVTLPAGLRLAGTGAGDGWQCEATASGASCDRPRWKKGARSVARLPVLADATVSGFQQVGVTATYGQRHTATAFRVPVAPSGLRLGHAARGRVDVAMAGSSLLSCRPRPLCLLGTDNNMLDMSALLPAFGEPAAPDGLLDEPGPAGPKGPITALAGEKAASGARLEVPDGAKVRWAGLVVAASAARLPELVALHGPKGDWSPVEVRFEHAGSGASLTQGFADVTRLLRRGGGGDWWLAAPAEPLPRGKKQFAGWTLAVVYEHGDVPRGEAAVYLGPRAGRGDAATIVGLGGAGGVRVGLALWDGDLALTGDELVIDGVPAGEPGNLGGGRNAGAAAVACRTVPGLCPWRTPGLDVLWVAGKAPTGGVAELRMGGDPMEVGLLAVITGPPRTAGKAAPAR
ncbi:sigma-70 family RNA polymerase sigma factor [Catellatospora vulcania]|uniref:sigma-70 family RNA polymerase sigma factor n=1 Tax=Catellatospora vulcania TaxID=1460450 RepID=UPI0018AFC464|nr:sigma-70 family RNA polymerase sigma factor [Catellatospora vulcania]